MAKEKVLGDLPIAQGTGKKMAEASMKLFRQWGITNIIGLGHDTTSSNTGSLIGKFTVREKVLVIKFFTTANHFYHFNDFRCECVP